MKRIFFLFAFIQFYCLAANSQSVYYFQYNFNQPDNKTDYYAFFSLQEDGTAFARVRFVNPVDKQDAIVEMKMEEDFVFIRPGEIDTTKILYRSVSRAVKSDNGNVKLDTPLTFVFKINTKTDESEPAGVLAPGEKDLNSITTFKSEYIDALRLRNPSFLSIFFSEGDEFYDKLMAPKSKGLNNNEKDMKMWMLIVGNITDVKIGNECKYDMERFEKSMTDIGVKLGIAPSNINTTKLSGSSFSKKTVQAAIAGLKGKITPKKDIVVFYYTGHGFKKDNKHRFPSIDLRTDTNEYYLLQAINMEDDVLNKITPLGAKLSLVIGDCCNFPVIVPKTTVKKKGKKKSLGFFASEPNMRKLFLPEVPTTIFACSADTGQYATTHPDYGSYFSYFFKSGLESYCSVFKNDVSWQGLLAEVNTQTTKLAYRSFCELVNGRCVQKPINKILPEPAKPSTLQRGF